MGKLLLVQFLVCCILAACSGSDDGEGEDTLTDSGNSENGHEWVDLGLSVKWATCNVGAPSPDAYGDYFAWAETRPKDNYGWGNLKYCLDNNGNRFAKYVTNSRYGTVDNLTTLEMMDDAARQNWGGNWRLPTDKEFEELLSQCTWTWATQGVHDGYKVTSKANGNSIFLPAAGWRDGSDPGYVGTDGSYWSSSLSTSLSYGARILYFYDGGHDTNDSYRKFGLSIRPVIAWPVSP